MFSVIKNDTSELFAVKIVPRVGTFYGLQLHLVDETRQKNVSGRDEPDNDNRMLNLVTINDSLIYLIGSLQPCELRSLPMFRLYFCSEGLLF